MFTAVAASPPGIDPECSGRLVEVDRLEWRLGDGGDPADLVSAFCSRYAGAHTGADGAVCGVAVLVSAAAGAAMIGGATGMPSPVPAVPDLALVAYVHGPERSLAPPGDFAVGAWQRSWSPADHAKAVAAVQDAIGRGEVYQACVVGHRSAPWSGDPARAAAAVRGIEGARWGGALAGEDWMVASASGECFLEADSHRAATFPIKGTAPATVAGHSELLASVKERAEHIMIVDLERNDLARVAAPGTVAVPELFSVHQWAHLWQAESTVRCELAPGTGIADLLRAMCPPGSVTGTPKLSMLETVASLEPVGRGPAMGAFGYYSGGRLRMAVTIRTVALDADRLHVWAGGGITWRSDPGLEVAEAEAKAAGVIGALDALSPGGSVASGQPDHDGLLLRGLAQIIGPLGPVQAQPGCGAVELDDAPERHRRIGMDAPEPCGAGAAVVAAHLDGAMFQLELS